MTDTMTKKLLAECVRLNKAAVVDVGRARESQEAVAVALLAIEARLAMVALFVIAAMEDDDQKEEATP